MLAQVIDFSTCCAFDGKLAFLHVFLFFWGGWVVVLLESLVFTAFGALFHAIFSHAETRFCMVSQFPWGGQGGLHQNPRKEQHVRVFQGKHSVFKKTVRSTACLVKEMDLQAAGRQKKQSFPGHVCCQNPIAGFRAVGLVLSTILLKFHGGESKTLSSLMGHCGFIRA